LLNENFKKIGAAILGKRLQKLRDSLSNIGPGLLFDRTDKVLQEQGDTIMTIGKYEEAIAEQCRRIIESNETLRSLLSNIEDLNNRLIEEQNGTP
jgi:uncharacterized coiled-coil protein SlyX